VQALVMRLVAFSQPPRQAPQPPQAPILHVVVTSPAEARALLAGRVFDGQAVRVPEGSSWPR
jgi:hypothetical protein